MRKTLHTLPLELAVVAHGATLHFRERDALRAITNANVSLQHIPGTIDVIVALLEEKARRGPQQQPARSLGPRASSPLRGPRNLSEGSVEARAAEDLHPDDARYLDDKDAVRTYGDLWCRLTAAARGPVESVDVIRPPPG